MLQTCPRSLTLEGMVMSLEESTPAGPGSTGDADVSPQRDDIVRTPKLTEHPASLSVRDRVALSLLLRPERSSSSRSE